MAFPRFIEPFSTPLSVIFAPLLGEVDASLPRADEMAAFGRRLLGVDPKPAPLSLNRLEWEKGVRHGIGINHSRIGHCSSDVILMPFVPIPYCTPPLDTFTTVTTLYTTGLTILSASASSAIAPLTVSASTTRTSRAGTWPMVPPMST